MDVNVCSYILLVFVTLELQKTTATIPGITLSITDGGNRGDKPTATCTLKMDDVVSSTTTTRQESEDGMSGLGGITGPPGIMGVPGLAGPPGIKGEIGESIIGPRGYPGPVGPVGNPGLTGRPGKMGSCECEDTDTEPKKYDGDAKEFGTQESPSKVPCKYAPRGLSSGFYYMGSKLQSFRVYCNMTNKETCLKRSESLYSLVSFGNEEFWLSSQGINIMEEFYVLSAKQIKWLQKRSTYVRQTLKYNCVSVNHSKPFNLSSVVQLLTWNDVLIGPKPTSKSPFFYDVPSSTDGCMGRSGYEQTSYIKLKSSNVNRLPITDVWISYINDETEAFTIYTEDLCFG